MPPRWLPTVLARIRTLAEAGRARLTLKALRELAGLGMGLDEGDACDILAGLTSADFAGRIASERTNQWMYVFKPVVAATMLYLKGHHPERLHRDLGARGRSER
jgi:hypothetical protein